MPRGRSRFGGSAPGAVPGEVPASAPDLTIRWGVSSPYLQPSPGGRKDSPNTHLRLVPRGTAECFCPGDHPGWAAHYPGRGWTLNWPVTGP